MIILIGMAGTGKSTQGERLAEKYGWQWRSAGQMLRDSGKFTEIQGKGELVGLDAVREYIIKPVVELEKAGQKVILDGFPRGKEQTEWAMEHSELAERTEVVLCLTCSEEESEQRLLARGRADDTPEVIRKRVREGADTLEQERATFQKYGQQVIEVDGAGTRGEVQERLEQALREVGIIK